MPWYTKPDTLNSTFKFNLKVFVLMFIGGSFEFVGNQFLTNGFQSAQLVGINQGIVSALVSSNTFYILVASLILFREKIIPLQLIGLVLIVIAVSIVTIFNRSEGNEEDQSLASNDNSPIDQPNNQFTGIIALLSGLLAGILFGSQLLLLKFLMKMKVSDSFSIGFSFLLFGSFYGISCLFYLMIFDFEVFATFTLANYLSSLTSGIFLGLGIVCINVACNLGNPGICNSIMSTQCILLTLCNYIFFDQNLNWMQGLGVLICVIGVVLVSIANSIQC
ncbi:UNKNOWN [Stylonychia lemnae]|uniref:EamA domain-containing protein n=1 Tax=Stylonychia lemnae TaxID=5949 RepID=A0A078B1A6_STYLE|nr:UNKNOWN [Stylonychia lemnae]|eukprot:CDW88334.1 UNKNOWN [Stylonychia lemnae]